MGRKNSLGSSCLTGPLGTANTSKACDPDASGLKPSTLFLRTSQSWVSGHLVSARLPTSYSASILLYSIPEPEFTLQVIAILYPKPRYTCSSGNRFSPLALFTELWAGSESWRYNEGEEISVPELDREGPSSDELHDISRGASLHVPQRHPSLLTNRHCVGY